MSNSDLMSVRVTWQTRRFVPPISRARYVPVSLPSGKDMTQVGFMGYMIPSSARLGPVSLLMGR